MFRCNTFEGCDINILSFGQLAKNYKISYYRDRDCFVVHTDEYDIVFEKVGGQYCSNILDWESRRHSVFNIVSDREKLYTKKEIEGARRARMFQKNAGCLSYGRATIMIEGNQFEGMDLTVRDLDIAYDIYGPVVQEVRGKLTKRKVRSRAGECVSSVSSVNKSQNLSIDIFYVGKVKFLLSVMLPMGLCLVKKLDSRAGDSVVPALESQLKLLASRGYEIGRITSDNEASFRLLENKFPSIQINAGGAGDHVADADIRIRRIKDIIRSVVSGLKWKVPSMVIEFLVRFAVSRYNLQQHDRNVDCPRVQFTKWKPKFNKELDLCFGDYAEAYNPSCVSNDALQSRSEPCIALCPVGNTHGSWYFLNLNSNRVVCRSNWKRMFTNDWIISRMNAMQNEGVLNLETDLNVAEDAETISESEIGVTQDKDVTEEASDVSENEAADDTTEGVSTGDDEVLLKDLISTGDDEDEILLKDLVSDDDTILRDLVDDDEESFQLDLEMEVLPVRSAGTRTSARLVGKKPAGFYNENKVEHQVLHISLKKGIEKHGELAVAGINSEFQQMIDKEVWTYVLSYYGSYLRSSMFLKEKMDMDGVVYKVKARLVADGSTQVLQPYEFTFTPTIKSSSINCMLKIAAAENRSVKAIDISGAYLHAKMKGDVYMNLDKNMVEYLVKIDETCKEYIRDNGSVMVKLEKALYGCKTSGLLWFERITTYLKSLGFVQNPYDECVFNIMKNGVQLTVGIHVDDLLATSAVDENYTWLSDMLKLEFKEITEQTDAKISYLGMQIEKVQNGINISMPTMVDDILDGVSGTAASPALEDLFESGESLDLCEARAEYYHSTTAKLLYLSGKIRNDIALAVSYLCTRVTKPTENDMNKLNRVLKYLNGTRNNMIHVSNSDITGVSAMIDAAFAAHEDGKSHTGQVIFLGDMVVQAKSTKQKIVTKDSTESELVGLADKILDVTCIHEFVSAQGVKIGVPVIYQDNKSTIQWTDVSSKKLRNKYMLVRQELVKQGVKNNDFKIEYLKTTDMVADILTKPLQGMLFKKLRSLLSGAKCINVLGVTLDESGKDSKNDTLS